MLSLQVSSEQHTCQSNEIREEFCQEASQHPMQWAFHGEPRTREVRLFTQQTWTGATNKGFFGRGWQLVDMHSTLLTHATLKSHFPMAVPGEVELDQSGLESISQKWVFLFSLFTPSHTRCKRFSLGYFSPLTFCVIQNDS